MEEEFVAIINIENEKAEMKLYDIKGGRAGTTLQLVSDGKIKADDRFDLFSREINDKRKIVFRFNMEKVR